MNSTKWNLQKIRDWTRDWTWLTHPRHAPHAKNCVLFHAVWGKFWKMYMLAPSPRGLAPPTTKILDLLLYTPGYISLRTKIKAKYQSNVLVMHVTEKKFIFGTDHIQQPRQRLGFCQYQCYCRMMCKCCLPLQHKIPLRTHHILVHLWVHYHRFRPHDRHHKLWERQTET